MLPEGAIPTPTGGNLLGIAFAHLLPGEALDHFNLGGREFIVLSQ